MTKIDIISGFLGAGKTTLIKKLLKEALQGEQIVLIENEFGEIGIDGGFLKESGIQITEMNSGCICCSLVGDFGQALEEVLTKFHPDRILIEPSGVGKLSDVIHAVQGIQEKIAIELNSFVTVVDAGKAKMYMKNFGEFFNNQLESANTIILSRTQGMDQKKLEACVAMLREHNGKAVIITTPWDAISGEQIKSAMEQGHSLAEEMLAEMKASYEDQDEDEECEHHHHHHEEDEECECHHHHHHEGDEECGCHHHHHGDEHHHHHHHHDADEVFTSWGQETPHVYAQTDLEEILKKLSETNDYGMILRAKGIVPAGTGEWLHFDMTPGEYQVRKGAADYTGRLCVIGSELKEEELAKLFQLV